MIKTETKAKTTTRTVVVSITCDRCGKETFTPYSKHPNLSPETRIGDGWVDGGHCSLGDFNFGSVHDGLYRTFDICDDCTPLLIAWFEAASIEDAKEE